MLAPLVQHYQWYKSIKTAYARIRNQFTEFKNFWNYKIFSWLPACHKMQVYGSRIFT